MSGWLYVQVHFFHSLLNGLQQYWVQLRWLNLVITTLSFYMCLVGYDGLMLVCTSDTISELLNTAILTDSGFFFLFFFWKRDWKIWQCDSCLYNYQIENTWPKLYHMLYFLIIGVCNLHLCRWGTIRAWKLALMTRWHAKFVHKSIWACGWTHLSWAYKLCLRPRWHIY